MDFSTLNKPKARIAWGGDRYNMSDGKPTEYYINLQREKVQREQRQKRFADNIVKSKGRTNDNTTMKVLVWTEVINRNIKNHNTRRVINERSVGVRTVQREKTTIVTRRTPRRQVMPLAGAKRTANSINKKQKKINNQPLIKPLASLSKVKKHK